MIQSHRRKVFRANLDDVENLSYGRGAKKQRGTGSRFTCHRLNRDERRIFDRAKRDGFLTVQGTGYRKNRKGSPVWNTFRQRCDALARVCVVIERRTDADRVVIDLSTLRIPNDASVVSHLLEAVFRSNHPALHRALIATDRDETGAHQPVAQNTTNRPIRWEAVQSKPIWGVDERILAVTCERDVAQSIALDVLRETGSAGFAFLLSDAAQRVDGDATRTYEAGPSAPPRPCHETIPAPDGTSIDADGIDWNDI